MKNWLHRLLFPAYAAELGQIAAETAATLRRPEQMTDEELAAALDIEVGNDLWCAVHQVLDEEIQGAIEAASAAPAGGKVTEADRTFAAGGVDALRDLQSELAGRRARARVKAAEVVAGEKEEA
jgi:hypothetical protein